VRFNLPVEARYILLPAVQRRADVSHPTLPL
jgi:hypothetical protein